MKIFAKLYANHRAPALFLTGWQPCSSVVPGTWRSFLHLRLARSSPGQPCRRWDLPPGLPSPTSLETALAGLVWGATFTQRATCPMQNLPPGPWAHSSGPLASFSTGCNSRLPSFSPKSKMGGAVGTCECPHGPTHSPSPSLNIRPPTLVGGSLEFCWSFSPH